MSINPKALIGRSIVAVDMQASVQGESRHDRRTMHKPLITLDDGSVLYFVVEEHPEGAEYGVDIGRKKTKKSRR